MLRSGYDENKRVHLHLRDGNLLLPISGRSHRLFSRESLVRAVGGRIISENAKRYVQCIKNIELELEAGDRIGLIGHNGAGKTSLLRILAGIYPLSSGEYSSSGTISTFISVGTGASTEMTAEEYLQFQCIVKSYDKSKAETFISDILDFVELGEFAYMPIRTYSAGMRSRLFASAAIFFPCDILLIDEGIGAGDSQFNQKFNQKLDQFFESAKILVLASHSQELMKKWCDKAVVMRKGEIVFAGDTDEAFDFYSQNQ